MNPIQFRIEQLERLAVDDDSPRHDYESTHSATLFLHPVMSAVAALHSDIAWQHMQISPAGEELPVSHLTLQERASLESVADHQRRAINRLTFAGRGE
jgi:hypothetical protein